MVINDATDDVAESTGDDITIAQSSGGSTPMKERWEKVGPFDTPIPNRTAKTVFDGSPPVTEDM